MERTSSFSTLYITLWQHLYLFLSPENLPFFSEYLALGAILKGLCYEKRFINDPIQYNIEPHMCIDGVKDTAKGGGHAKCRQSDNGSEYDKTAEQDFKLFARQTRPDVVDEGVNLTQAEHTQCLQ